MIELRPLRAADGVHWRQLRVQDETLIRPWDPTVLSNWSMRHTRSAWADHRSMMRQAARRGQALPFAVLLDRQFVGQVTIGNIQRFPVHNGWIGYWIGSPYSGRGVATVAVCLAVVHAFGPGRLHRLEATVAPENVASQRVLSHLGFRQEGLLKRYLDIDGAWRDHQLWAITEEEVPADPLRLLTAWQSQPPRQAEHRSSNPA